MANGALSFMLEQANLQSIWRRITHQSTLSPKAKHESPRLRWLPLLIGLIVLAIWHLSTAGQPEASFIVAPPLAVARQFGALVTNGSLFRHIGTTLLEMGIGLALGVGAAFVLGYGIAHNWLLDRVFSPYVVGFQAVPIVAIAPVLIRFFGPGIASNGIICALIVFFPMLVSTIVGLRNVSPEHRELMHTFTAHRWQMFAKLELPAALPVLFGGLKVSTTLAVAAAVVGEAVSANAGLGFLIYSARYVYDTSSVLVGIFTLTALALTLYGVVTRIERRVLHWQHRN
jgi:NitT/TauT family transport system permease protein